MSTSTFFRFTQRALGLALDRLLSDDALPVPNREEFTRGAPKCGESTNGSLHSTQYHTELWAMFVFSLLLL